MNKDLKFAVLIDADNISHRYIKTIFSELPSNGVATIRRIYGDWTSPSLSSWKPVLLANSIMPVQQYAYTSGKNATDSAMIIDAMDILYSDKVGGFCLVASDSDYTRLAARLRESGATVIGMGETKTPSPFINACNQFKYLDILSRAEDPAPLENGSEKPSPSAPAAKAPADDHLQTTTSTISRAMQDIVRERSDEDGWLPLAEMGLILSKRFPDFDARNFGFGKLTPFVQSLNLFDVKGVEADEGKIKHYFIKNKAGQ